MKLPTLTRIGLWAALAACSAATTLAATVDLATSPMISGLSKVVPPNIFVVLDDSGSMAWDYLPDTVNNNNVNPCFKNWGFNLVFYNPNINYLVPLTAAGVAYANSTFTAAKNNGFASGNSNTNLSTSFVAGSTSNSGPSNSTATNSTTTVTGDTRGSASYPGSVKTSATTGTSPNFTYTDTYTYPASAPSNSTSGNTITSVTTQHVVTVVYKVSTGKTVTTDKTVTATSTASGDPAQAAYYYDYTSTPATPPNTCAADTAYTKHVIATAAEQQNFANWYTYYRTRIQMMKSALGRSFNTINANYRVGFTQISEPATSNSRFLNLAAFTGTQKTNWYTMLYAVSPSGTTPLRGALSKAGRLYAGKLITGNSDPVQYSCQQNFTLMTTDGYWNNGSDTATYGPFKEDNVTPVGDQDGLASVVRPFYDAYQSPNSLADIAYYYYNTDLRPTTGLGGLTADGVTRVDVSTNNVPTTSGDTANWQHMTTFTLGLGVSGILTYNSNYLTGGSTDYNAILQGTKNWPDPLTSNNGNSVVSRIDDLWHAAVNGHGKYLSAGDPDSVAIALNQTLAAISKSVGAAAAAATSSLQPVAGDNFAYVAQYTTALWQGDLMARTIDLVTGAVSTASSWSAGTQLVAQVSATTDTRTIYTFSSVASNKLKAFTTANLGTEKTANYFKSDSTNPGGALSQYVNWSPVQQLAATNDAMIAYIRGETGNQENTNNLVQLYRDRATPLGDIVNGAPVYVKKPPFSYLDTGYAAYVTAQSSRTGVVYAGANDGMLHAFNATTGSELWAYIPSVVIPNLYKLADDAYPNNHKFFVDGTIIAGDAYNGTSWSTIVIGGLGDGGKAFYALDVTDPANPKALWEFTTTTNANIGYSYGNPILTKRASDGKWVVIFTSGYNNVGDSKGHLFVVDAFSGAQLQDIITDNSVVDPNVSGIAKVTNYVEATLTDNTTRYVYGGDLGGALWRFDLTAGSSQRLGETSATLGNQPITVKPELGSVKDSTGTSWRVIFFGTGRYLGFNDLSAASTSATVAQAIYAVKDTGTDLGVLTLTPALLVAQTLNSSVTPRTIDSPLPVDYHSQNGWYVTFPVGERVDVDLKLQLGTLVAVSNVPKDDYCTVGGSSWLYAFNYANGSAITSQSGKYVGFPVGSAIATGVTLVKLPTGKVVAIVTEADTTLAAVGVPTSPTGGGTVRRVDWREIQ